ncbi:terminase small subunit [Alsobacter soli]|nr:terminase small subunit [Alsobacter soli]
MPDPKGRLTAQERTFAKHYAATGDGAYSARMAGYGSPAQRASANLQKPGVLAEVRLQARKRLESEGAEVGVQTLIEIATDRQQPGGTRVRAAAELVKQSGIGRADDGRPKEPHEMTASELQQAIEHLERLAGDRAKIISGVAVVSGAERDDIFA